MKRSTFTIALATLVAVAIALPLGAAPTVSKRVVDENGKTVVLVNVVASGYSVYGIDIKGGSIKDLKAPKGWVGITSGSRTIFRTGGEPVKSGATVTFRLYMEDTAAPLDVTFRDDKNKERGAGKI
jgi:hypothetical protein